MINKNKKINFIIFTLFFFLAFLPVSCKAANFYFDPSEEERVLGDIFPVSVLLESADQNIYSVSGTVDFPSNLLEVISVSEKNSIVNLWDPQISFSNKYGTVDFNGSILGEGFKGQSGKILTINFKVKKEGTAVLDVLKASILKKDANENLVADIYKANLKLVTEISSEPVAETKEVLTTTVSDENIIKSSTHPDSSKWYNKKSADFSWTLPAGVSEVKLLANMNASGTPTFHYKNSLTTKTVDDLSDGKWYFHIQFKEGENWGKIYNFPFNIDTKAPSGLEIKKTSDGESKFSFNANDEASGIDFYEVAVDDKLPVHWTSDNNPLAIDETKNKKMTVTVFDKAGNSTSTTLSLGADKEMLGVVAENNDDNENSDEKVFDNKIFSGFLGFVKNKIEINLWTVSLGVCILIILVQLITVMVLKRKLKKSAYVFYDKLKKAEVVLNDVYENIFDQTEKLENILEVDGLSGDEKEILEKLQESLDLIEKEYHE